MALQTKQKLSKAHFVIALTFFALLLLTSTSLACHSNFIVYNYLSIQGPKSTTGYNTALCGMPTHPQANSFAQTYCFDMPLLAQQDLNSKLLGQVQGTFVFVSLTGGPTLFVSESFTINTTLHQGTFTGVGLEQIGQVSSKPITGGTGDFAFVSGVAQTTPLSTGTDSNGNYYAWFMYKFTFHHRGV